jgi:lycopene cyclase domain-containing protein
MQHLVKPSKAWWTTLIVLLILTAIFDSIIIAAGIVEYSPNKILGIYLGFAPIEDFFYAVLAVIIVPALWNVFETKKETMKK